LNVLKGVRSCQTNSLRNTRDFQAPPAAHLERDHLLCYYDRGYSVCLINVGGYGDFSAIVSPILMMPFMHIVLGALSSANTKSAKVPLVLLQRSR
jgi:hypothetical protein